ncbi:MAG: hypothetical protein JRN20_17675 [Nitrososphaerota archaeon]|nr:hypothetical protein [Nitrososphaerota archaeon]
MQDENSVRVNINELLADVYKKRAELAKELDNMAQDPKQKKTRRYHKVIYSYDKLTKRVADLVTLAGQGKEKEDGEKSKDIIALVEWYRTHHEKKQLMTFKDATEMKKQRMEIIKDASEHRDELEELIDRAMKAVFGDSFSEFRYERDKNVNYSW